MAKIIAAFNMTLDGNCDHRAGLPDKQVHQHYSQLLDRGNTILYGRKTYQLMEFWRAFLKTPSDEASMNEFARAIDAIEKLVLSHTLRELDWPTAILANQSLEQTVLDLKQQPGGEVYIGSRSLIDQLTELQLIDQYQICIFPVIAGPGIRLFENIQQRQLLKLTGITTLDSGAAIHCYEPDQTAG